MTDMNNAFLVSQIALHTRPVMCKSIRTCAENPVVDHGKRHCSFGQDSGGSSGIRLCRSCCSTKAKLPSNSWTHANQGALELLNRSLEHASDLPWRPRPLGNFAFAESFTSYEFEFSGERAGEVVGLARLSATCRKLQSFPFGNCTMAVHCQQSQCPSRTWRCSLWFLTSMFWFDSPVSGLNIPRPQMLLNTSFGHCFQLMIIRFRLFLMSLHVVQFEYGLQFLRLSYSHFVQTVENINGRELLHR